MKERILVLSPDAGTQATLSRVLTADGFACESAATAENALALLKASPAHLILIDHGIPGGALGAMRDLSRLDSDLSVLVIVDEQDVASAVEAVRRGASDFVTRPYDEAKIPIRIRVTLEKRKRAVDERIYRVTLEKRINTRTEEVWDKKVKLRAQMLNTIRALNQALQAKHTYTEGHSKRVAEVSLAIARALKLTPAEVNVVELGALFHDIGKIGIRDEILNKPSSLTDSEYEHVKAHPLIAEQILSPLEELRPIMEIVRHEHERFDGSGYPYGLKGEDIPLGARIVAVADAWDAMVTVRSYKKGMPREAALAEIRRSAGTHFDPKLVEVFCEMMEGRIARTREQVSLPGAGNGNGSDPAPVPVKAKSS